MAERRLTRRTMGRRQHRTSTRGSPSDGHVVVTATWDCCVLDDGVDRDTRRLGHGHQQKTSSPCPEAKDVNTLPQCPGQAWLPCDCMGLWGALTAGILRVLSISPCAPRVPGMLMDPTPPKKPGLHAPSPMIQRPPGQGCIGGGGGYAPPQIRYRGLVPNPPPSTAHSLCPATVPLTAHASLNGICNRL